MEVGISLYGLTPENCETLSALESWANNLQNRLRTLRESFGNELADWSLKADIKDEGGLDDVVLYLRLTED